MRKLIAVVCLLLGFAVADTPEKLWVGIQYRQNHDRVIYIEDRETGTHCYAITNDEVNVSGYAISCVPRGGTK